MDEPTERHGPWFYRNSAFPTGYISAEWRVHERLNLPWLADEIEWRLGQPFRVGNWLMLVGVIPLWMLWFYRVSVPVLIGLLVITSS